MIKLQLINSNLVVSFITLSRRGIGEGNREGREGEINCYLLQRGEKEVVRRIKMNLSKVDA